jgi:tRNA G18 (ribose-2'-O)-methylase SpoU
MKGVKEVKQSNDKIKESTNKKTNKPKDRFVHYLNRVKNVFDTDYQINELYKENNKDINKVCVKKEILKLNQISDFDIDEKIG